MASLSGASAALLEILTLLLARSMSTVAPASTALTALVTALTQWPQLMFSTCNWYIALLLLGVDSATNPSCCGKVKRYRRERGKRRRASKLGQVQADQRPDAAGVVGFLRQFLDRRGLDFKRLALLEQAAEVAVDGVGDIAHGVVDGFAGRHAAGDVRHGDAVLAAAAFLDQDGNVHGLTSTAAGRRRWWRRNCL